MLYSIGEISNLMHISISALRYYDKEGLIPNIKRDKSGIRKFTENDINALRLINCLKNSGMQIKDIKKFIDWCEEGDSSLEKRLNMFKEQEQNILNQIEVLNESLELIKYKKWYYETAVCDKTEKNVKNIDQKKIPKKIRELYQKTHKNFK